MAQARLQLVAMPPQACRVQATASLRTSVGHASSAGRRKINEDFFGAVTPEGPVHRPDVPGWMENRLLLYLLLAG